MIYNSSERQTAKMLYLIGELLKIQSDGNSWKLKNFGFIPSLDDGDCSLSFLVFIDNTGLILYYTIKRDGTHSYNTIIDF